MFNSGDRGIHSASMSLEPLHGGEILHVVHDDVDDDVVVDGLERGVGLELPCELGI